MKITAHKQRYQQKMFAVFDYIDQHLDEDLNLVVISEVACFSKFHFHRQFCEYTGISLFKYLQLLRLKRASYQLVFNLDKSVLDIALDAQFSSSESFSRAFKKTFAQTPSQFRTTPLWKPWHLKYNISRGKVAMNASVDTTIKVNLITFEETRVAVYEHRGAVEGLNYSIEAFITWRKKTQLSPIKSSATFGLAYSDPATTVPEEFKFDICGEVIKAVAENSDGIMNKSIPAGLCAQIVHLGTHSLLDEKIHYLYGKWLPESGYSLRDFPCFFKYINFFPEVSEDKLITEIYLPIQ
ncbi:MAG: AraC family transcriptional regulator [Oceanospirillaceae bacterium]|jgi:AraC family transcriptional regulator